MSKQTAQRLWVGGVIALLLIVSSLLIGGGIWSNGGRNIGDGDHYQGIPRGVLELTSHDYLLQTPRIAPEKLCYGGTSDSTSSVESVNAVPHSSALFVECSQDQDWNNHGAPGINWGTGIAKLAVALPYDSLAALVILICLTPALLGMNSDRRSVRAKHKTLKIDAETKRRELRASYAKGEITDEQFEHGLNRLYGLGVKKEG